MAVVRCVNGLSDQNQNTKYVTSIYSLASTTLQLPKYIVDVRHAAAHGVMPSHHLLVYACDDLLIWLYEHFWQPVS